jgi:2-phosphosulfolactate phosphatase
VQSAHRQGEYRVRFEWGGWARPPTQLAGPAPTEWDDGTLRPAVEDLWGAGAVISGLADAGWLTRSPEADLAHAGYRAIRGRELDALRTCASGRELIEQGYAADVAIAAETASSSAVPVLTGDSFVPAHRTD